MDSGRVESVNVGVAVAAEWAGRLRRTAIDKRPVDGAVAVGRLGLAGDEQADRDNHGGPDQAVYAYAREDLAVWERLLGRPLRGGMFGENLTTRGVEVSRALVGERWRIGTALVEVTLPRVPCGTFRNWLGEEGWVRRFTEEARTGAYLRVLEEGEVGAGDRIEVAHRPDHGIDLATAFRASRPSHDDIALIRRVLEIPGRAAEWERAAAAAERRLARR
ncbi:MOSC domain-containing protein [Marinactinospora thermotolerans]|uniref:MOSC domain-containing protein YiiM n=1 Tax=Marinactinospora thermotolerans DSM 45154 TaxID=1122192 RepID=A0A1T4LN17_9ACTN|nr:MOSC domain-containing protein [Marinactinospora thermotolerans]SJZ55844.1 MOSC domain-containing protein YiiM [Marinactinospora thermotolerans DSM 45154]